jgi:hypothetical protein
VGCLIVKYSIRSRSGPNIAYWVVTFRIVKTDFSVMFTVTYSYDMDKYINRLLIKMKVVALDYLLLLHQDYS